MLSILGHIYFSLSDVLMVACFSGQTCVLLHVEFERNCVVTFRKSLYKKMIGGVPGDPVVKNLPANAGDTGSIPALGRFLVLRGNYAHGPQRLSQCSRACPSQLLKPHVP